MAKCKRHPLLNPSKFRRTGGEKARVPLVAWEFYIGGYQPAQKWLKDRKGRELGYEDILHYQKIVVALVETERIMVAVDKIGVV